MACQIYFVPSMTEYMLTVMHISMKARITKPSTESLFAHAMTLKAFSKCNCYQSQVHLR